VWQKEKKFVLDEAKSSEMGLDEESKVKVGGR
jgi:hypothetical protein